MIKGMQLGLLGVMLLVSMALAAAVSAESAGQNFSNYTMNFSNNTIPQEKKLPDNQTETVASSIVNNTGVGELPMSVFGEVVIVYFREMPASLEEFASKYSGKLVFVKQEIKMAAFETKSEKRPGVTSQQTLDLIDRVSKDTLVETAFEDGFLFLGKNNYSQKPLIQGPDYYTKLGYEYVPNRVRVGFWRFPPSLEGFASRYGGKLMNLSDADKVLKHASFETSNITEFIDKIANDPYVRSVALWDIGRPSDIGGIGVPSISATNTSGTDAPKAPGLEPILSIGLLVSVVYMMRRRKPR